VEGFADFYAADVWNDHDQTDCQYQVGSAGYDCEDGTGTSFSNGWLESQCATTHDNRGVELDWMRVFWAVHTMGAAPDPGFSEIVDWINDATLETGWGSWSSTVTPFSKLHAALPVGDIASHWYSAKATHHIGDCAH
jgi:hypothetical protein